MKFKGYMIMLIMLLISISISWGNTYCPQSACSNIFWTGTYIGSGSSSFTPAYTTATAWSSCALDNTLMDAVGADLNNDGLTEYVLTPTTTKISIYNSYCALVGSITESNIIVSPPVINDYDLDGNYDIMVLTNSTLDVYNGTSLAQIKSFEYRTVNGGALENMGCDDHYCFAKNDTSNSTAIFRLLCDYNICYTNFSLTIYNKVLPPRSSIEMPARNGISVFTDTINSMSRSSAWCYGRLSDATTVDCARQDSTGTVYTYTMAGGSFNVNSIQNVQSFFAKVGTTKILALTVLYNKTTSGYQSDSLILDENNNLLYDTSAMLGTATSNWMVGQFDKTSNTQACIIQYAQNRTLCYANGYFGDPSYNYTSTDYPVNSSSLYFMGDWNVSEPYFGFATSEGVYYASPGGKNYTVIRSGLKNYYAASASRQSPVISILNSPTTSVFPVFHFTGTPTVLYADSSASKLLKQGVAGSCNNGVCDAGELFSCPSDCSAVTPTYPLVCAFDAQCPPAYPKCVNGSCISGYSGIPCVDSSSCPINASFCFQGVCINGVSGGTIGTPGNTTPNPNIPIGVQIDNMINSLFQGSSLLRFIVGLVLLLVCTFEFNTQFNPGFKSQAAFLVIFSVFLILFTFINLLNKWIVYGIILTAFSLAIIFFILKFKPSEG